MDGQTTTKTFRLAPMSPIIRSITMLLLTLPLGFLVAALGGAWIHVLPCFIVLPLYGWIWLRFRPSSFVVTDQSLNVIWPLKRQEIPRETISTVRLLDREELKQEIGWSLRVGAGGLGGGSAGCGPHDMASYTCTSLVPIALFGLNADMIAPGC